jgi:hypothetical protein
VPEVKPARQERPQLRIVRHMSGGQRTLARVDLSRPGAIDSLNEVASDWLYERCGDEGRRKLLAQHQLLAA